MNTTRPRYLSVAETAKLIRPQLKAHFPGIKFSVRSSSYAGGASIDISWTDGPTTKEVDSVVGAYESKSFDGSIDMGCYWKSWLLPDGTAETAHGTGTAGSLGYIEAIDNPKPHPQAELVHFGADSVHCDRSFSAEFLQPIAEAVATKYGHPTPTVLVREWGAYVDRTAGSALVANGYDLGDMIRHEAYQTSAHQKAPETETAGRPSNGPSNGSGAVLGDYKGHPTISLELPNGRSFTFGLAKAAAILAHAEAIGRFVESAGSAV